MPYEADRDRNLAAGRFSRRLKDLRRDHADLRGVKTSLRMLKGRRFGPPAGNAGARISFDTFQPFIYLQRLLRAHGQPPKTTPRQKSAILARKGRVRPV